MSTELKWVLGVGGAVFAIVLLLVCFDAGVPLPPDWLVKWTEWIGQVVTIVVAARVFWAGAQLLGRVRPTG